MYRAVERLMALQEEVCPTKPPIATWNHRPQSSLVLCRSLFTVIQNISFQNVCLGWSAAFKKKSTQKSSKQTSKYPSLCDDVSTTPAELQILLRSALAKKKDAFSHHPTPSQGSPSHSASAAVTFQFSLFSVSLTSSVPELDPPPQLPRARRTSSPTRGVLTARTLMGGWRRAMQRGPWRITAVRCLECLLHVRVCLSARVVGCGCWCGIFQMKCQSNPKWNDVPLSNQQNQSMNTLVEMFSIAALLTKGTVHYAERNQFLDQFCHAAPCLSIVFFFASVERLILENSSAKMLDMSD